MRVLAAFALNAAGVVIRRVLMAPMPRLSIRRYRREAGRRNGSWRCWRQRWLWRRRWLQPRLRAQPFFRVHARAVHLTLMRTRETLRNIGAVRPAEAPKPCCILAAVRIGTRHEMIGRRSMTVSAKWHGTGGHLRHDALLRDGSRWTVACVFATAGTACARCADGLLYLQVLK